VTSTAKVYEHTQVGYLLIGVLSGTMVLIRVLLAVTGAKWVAVAVIIVLGVVLAMSASLTVTVREETLELRFGHGPIRKRFRLRDIQSCRVVRNPWYYGWGIHRTADGWLYNVSGFEAVEVTMATGDSYRIGTDAPRKLAEAIRMAASAPKDRRQG